MITIFTTVLLPILQILLSIGNLCILGYALLKFLNKPHNTLEARVLALETEMAANRVSLAQKDNRFKNQDEVNKVIIHSLLALIEFEIQYCLTEHKDLSNSLEQAKDNLHNFLSNRSFPFWKY